MDRVEGGVQVSQKHPECALAHGQDGVGVLGPVPGIAEERRRAVERVELWCHFELLRNRGSLHDTQSVELTLHFGGEHPHRDVLQGRVDVQRPFGEPPQRGGDGLTEPAVEGCRAVARGADNPHLAVGIVHHHAHLGPGRLAGLADVQKQQDIGAFGALLEPVDQGVYVDRGRAGPVLGPVSTWQEQGAASAHQAVADMMDDNLAAACAVAHTVQPSKQLARCDVDVRPAAVDGEAKRGERLCNQFRAVGDEPERIQWFRLRAVRLGVVRLRRPIR